MLVICVKPTILVGGVDGTVVYVLHGNVGVGVGVWVIHGCCSVQSSQVVPFVGVTVGVFVFVGV